MKEIDINKLIEDSKIEIEMFKGDFADIKTKDGGVLSASECMTVMCNLSGMTIDDLIKLKIDKYFVRMTKNFITSNTEKDIEDFVYHHLALRISNIIAK